MLALLHDDGDPIVITVRRDLIPPQPGRKDQAGNYLYFSFAEALDFAIKRNQQGWDAYIKHGRLTTLPPKGTRPDCRASNLWGSRSFFVDLDVGPDKAYSSTKEALTEVVSLVTSKQMMQPSLITATGHGLHLVWTVADLLPAKDWQVLKHLLYLKVRAAGLKPDPGAEPIERGVRLCGKEFVNRKNNENLPTRIIRELSRIPNLVFTTYFNPLGMTEVSTKPSLVKSEWHINTDIPWNPQESVEYCKIMYEARESGGVGHSYPYWSDLIALTSKATVEELGREMAHEFSSGHASYDAPSTDALYDNFRNGQVKAHVLCTTLRKHAPEHCVKCWFNNKVNSPAGIPGEMRRAGFMQTTPLPDGYFNTAKGLMRRKFAKEDNDVMVWATHHITNPRLAESYNPYSCQFCFDDTVIGSNVTTEVKLDMHILPGMREFVAAMTAQGRYMSSVNAKEMYLAMPAWIDSIRARNAGLTAYRRLGWVHLDKPAAKGFVLGDQYYETGQAPAKFQPDSFMKKFVPTGSPTDYNQIVNTILYNERRPEVHAHLSTSLAAPLIKLTPATGGAVVNYYSPQSGAGKTTITHLAASLWGQPSAMIGGVDDTSNASIARLGTLNNLPFFYDEARPINPQEFAKTMLFRTNHGVEKRRLNASSQLQETQDWSTLNVLTSNSSLGTALHTVKNHGDAAAARYLELQYRQPSQLNTPNMDLVGRAMLSLEHCYGHIGPHFAQLIVDHHGLIIQNIDTLTLKLMKYTRLDANDNAGRLHAITGACIILAAQMAIRGSLLPLDFKLVQTAVVQAIGQATKQRKESRLLLDPVTVLDQYLRTMEAFRIRTTTMTSGGRALELDHPQVRTPVVYEINQTTREVLVDLNQFHTHMAGEGQNADTVLRSLRKMFTVANRVIGHGTQYQSGARVTIVLPDSAPWSEYFT